jgi:hypothetical protein
MNATRIFSSAIILGMLGASLAQAAPPAKARGDYRPNFGRIQSSSSWSGTRYRAPVVRSAPVIASPAPTIVAQAPTEIRRFSYAPQAPAATSAPTVVNPCPPVTTVESGRRFSYAPAPAVEPVPVVRSYQPAYNRPAYRSGGGGRDLWALPKTDARKYSSR